MGSFTGFTAGVDLADRTSAVCVIGPHGEVVHDAIPTTAETLRNVFSKGVYDRVVIEASTHASWVGWLLQDCGQRVVVAHPRSVALIHQAQRKSDKRDAEKLARLARVDEDLLHPTHLRSRERTEGMLHVRARAALVSARTQLVNTARSLAKMMGVRLRRCTPEGFPEAVTEIEKEHPLVFAAVHPLAASIAALNEQIANDNKVIERLARRLPEVQAMAKIWGVGWLSALTFALVIDDPHRFPRTRDVGAYLGLVPKQDQTGESDRAMHISKAGHRYLRGLLTECAKRILRADAPETDLKRWGAAIATRGGKRAKRIATMAVARRLAVTMLAMWKKGDDYVPNRGVAMATAT